MGVSHHVQFSYLGLVFIFARDQAFFPPFFAVLGPSSKTTPTIQKLAVTRILTASDECGRVHVLSPRIVSSGPVGVACCCLPPSY